MTPELSGLVAATEAALDDPSLADDRARAEAIEPAMATLLATDGSVPEEACQPLDGAAVGNLLYVDPGGRFHVLAVVFPEGTSSGVHHHGCWGVIGYLRGGDEETRYTCTRDTGEQAELIEASRHVWHQGDITYLVPPEAGSVPERSAGSVPERSAGSVPEGSAGSVPEGSAGSVPERSAGSVPEGSGCWHRVRNPGPGTGVSVHVLCMTPADHPHRFWERESGTVLPFPFVEAAPGRWRAEVSWPTR